MSNKEENNTLFNKENPFRVPENYFDTLSDRILDTISKSESTSIKPVYQINWIKQIAVAASIVGIIFVSYSGYKFFNKTENINNQEIAQIIDTTDAEYSFVDEDNIVEAITTEIPVTENLEGDDIISYLVEDGVDENLIADAY
jgi:hypothetical protein